MADRAFFCSAISTVLTILMTLICGQAGYAASDATGVASFTAPAPIGGAEALAANIVYPAEAKREGIEGKVVVETVIDSDGKVKSAIVKTGIREDLDKAATHAICLTKWSAALKDGQPVEATVLIPVQFKIGEKKE